MRGQIPMGMDPKDFLHSVEYKHANIFSNRQGVCNNGFNDVWQDLNN